MTYSMTQRVIRRVTRRMTHRMTRRMAPTQDPARDPLRAAPQDPQLAAAGQRPLLRALLAHEPGENRAPLAAVLARAAGRARARGFVALDLGVQASAPLRELVNLHAAIALQGVRHGRPASPTAIVSAATALADGAAVEPAAWLLALAMALDANPAIHAGACAHLEDAGTAPDTCFIAPDTLARARQLGALKSASNAPPDAAGLFDLLGDRAPGASSPIFISAILLVPY